MSATGYKKAGHKTRRGRRRRLPAVPPIGGDVAGPQHRRGNYRTRERGIRAAARVNRAVKLARQRRAERQAERAAW